jgi:transcriptional regulator with XRE-family HTH domain
MSQSFGARLRYERERRQIALKSIAESTKIGVPLLEGLERDDVSRWPSGIFRKSFVRSYAAAIGLDPEAIVREFVERYPDPLEVHTATQEVIPPQSVSPLSIKLTIAWSGSVHDTIRRLVDCQVGRLRNLRIFQSANLPMVNSASQHGSAGAAPDPAPPV